MSAAPHCGGLALCWDLGGWLGRLDTRFRWLLVDGWFRRLDPLLDGWLRRLDPFLFRWLLVDRWFLRLDPLFRWLNAWWLDTWRLNDHHRRRRRRRFTARRIDTRVAPLWWRLVLARRRRPRILEVVPVVLGLFAFLEHAFGRSPRARVDRPRGRLGSRAARRRDAVLGPVVAPRDLLRSGRCRRRLGGLGRLDERSRRHVDSGSLLVTRRPRGTDHLSRRSRRGGCLLGRLLGPLRVGGRSRL
mmetsp:Transcript_13445/g.53971  ORF Transcript_13445/g.53971 Transcript_13445/m.53971 type:complete len:244 (+) Transcript_13445:543-1274(+)